MTRIGTAVLALLACATAAHALEGTWITTPEEALARATREQKPVLAVAMDHA